MNESSAYEDLLRSSSNPIWILDDQELTVVAVNDAALRLYGYTRDEIIGMSAAMLRPPSERQRWKEYVRSHRGHGYAGVWVHQTKYGTQFEVEITFTLINYGDKPARLVLVRPVHKVLAKANAQ
jgi:two-component system, cell cycle sensor histidine kinase and response regulator CckA